MERNNFMQIPPIGPIHVQEQSFIEKYKYHIIAGILVIVLFVIIYISLSKKSEVEKKVEQAPKSINYPKKDKNKEKEEIQEEEKEEEEEEEEQKQEEKEEPLIDIKEVISDLKEVIVKSDNEISNVSESLN